MTEKIVIVDFGSQYTQLIARRIREMQVYCEIVPYNKFRQEDSRSAADIKDTHSPFGQEVKGVILSGSPCSVRGENARRVNLEGIKRVPPFLVV